MDKLDSFYLQVKSSLKKFKTLWDNLKLMLEKNIQRKLKTVWYNIKIL